MKATVVEKDTFDGNVLLFDMPRYSFGVDESGTIYFHSYDSVHQLGFITKSWESRHTASQMPPIIVKLLRPGDKVILEVE